MTKEQFPKYDKKDYSDLENDPYVQKFLNGVKSTKQRLSLIQEFCEFNDDMTPKELIIEHSKDKKIEDPIDQTNIAKRRLHSFFGYLTQNEDKRWSNTINDKVREKRAGWNSARQYAYSKIASFYKRNGVSIEFNKKEIPTHRKKEEEQNKAWKKDGDNIEDYKMILKLIKDSLKNIRDKAVLLCKLSSGMDDVDLFELKIKDFTTGYYKQNNVSYQSGNRIKTGEYFQTFFNSEACDMLEVYFKHRGRKEEILTDNSWLFVGNKTVVVDGEEKYTQFKPRLFAAELRETCKMLKIEGVTPKAIRRAFNSILKEKLLLGTRKRMMGQATGVNVKYDLDFTNPIKFKNYYVDHIEPHLLLGNGNGKIRKVNEEIDALKKTIEILTKDNEELRKSIPNLIQEEIKKLEERMIKRQKTMKGYQDQVKDLFED